MNIYRYWVKFRNCHYQIIEQTGYTIATDADAAATKIKEEYGEDIDLEIEDANVIEL